PPTGAIFCPSFDTSQTGPTFSVTSIRPSGRNAIRQGSSNVVVVVIVKGTPTSGFCSPALTCAQAPADATASSNVAFTSFIFVFSLLAIQYKLQCTVLTAARANSRGHRPPFRGARRFEGYPGTIRNRAIPKDLSESHGIPSAAGMGNQVKRGYKSNVI